MRVGREPLDADGMSQGCETARIGGGGDQDRTTAIPTVAVIQTTTMA